MDRNLAIVLATLVLALGVGLVLGRQSSCGCGEGAPVDQGARDHAPRVAEGTPPAHQPVLLEGNGPDNAALVARIDALEKALARLAGEQEKVAGMLARAEKAAAFLELVKSSPRLATARLDANQTAAIATLRNATSAQAQAQASARIDVDEDGTGEYGGFRELSGDVVGRMSARLVPPVLSGAFRKLTENGEAMRSGYLYRFYLPDGRGAGVGEPEGGFDRTSGVDPDLAETTWCCYAWPIDKTSGSRTYFMNQGGDMFATEDPRYVGSGNGPAPDAAFREAGSIVGAVANGTPGQDGNTWTQVG